MKAKDLLSLVRESSKGTKHVDGELKTPSYDNLNTPDNHVQGKGTKEVKNAKKDFGKKRDKKNPANPGTPRKKEKGREMGGPPKSYKRMNEVDTRQDPRVDQALAATKKGILQSIQKINRETGEMVIAQRSGKPVHIQMDPETMKDSLAGVLKQIKATREPKAARQLWDNFVQQAASQDQGSKTMQGRPSSGHSVGKPMTAKTWMKGQHTDWDYDRSGQQGTRAVFNSEGEEDDWAGNPWAEKQRQHAKKRAAFSPQQAHQVEKMKKMGIVRPEDLDESYADTDSMSWEQPVKKGGPVSKTAKVRGKVDDEPKNKADPGKPKGDGKDRMGDGANLGKIMNPKKVAQVHEGLKGLEELLGRKLKISLSEESEEELRKQLRKARQRGATDEIKSIKAKLGLDQPDYGGKVSASSAASEVGRQRNESKRSFNRGSKSTVREGMDPVLYQYLRTALWSSNDESTPEGGDSMDHNYDVDDIAPESVQLAQQMILKFQKAAGKLLDGLDMTRVAHDLWLTQNGHGAGFWDGDYEDPPGLGDKLTEIAKQLGGVTPYVGDDGVIYFFHG